MEVVPSTMENLLSRTLVKVLERLFHKPTASWLDSLRKQSASRVRSGTRLINVLTFTASQHLFRCVMIWEARLTSWAGSC